ncbi:MAG TPA: SGNH/GDSL hydrolase family protein [Gemmatimonadaceae bacterium]|nr:SGNH/GDSL hydrolase family protein [Gemmatimonadaceae bacterium]
MRAPLRLFIALWLLACSPQVVGQNAATVSPALSAPSQWEPDFAQFEAQDRANPPRPGSIVFVGSSSIRMWASLDRDFPSVPVLNRGFGGSEAGDVAQFAERIVVPYKPPVVVFYAGDNDLAAGKTPAQVLDAFQSFVATMHRELPGTRVVFVSIKPSIARWNIVDKMRAANQLVRDYARTDDRLVYVDVFTPMLDASGLPRRELFLEDGLHMTSAGYAIWRELIAPVIR